MYFVGGFILFFVLDLLISSRFNFFGMISEEILYAAVGFFTTFILWKNLSLVSDDHQKRIIKMWTVFILIVSTFSFFGATFCFWDRFIHGKDSIYHFFENLEDYILLILSVIVILVSYLSAYQKILRKWFLLASGSLAFKHAIYILWDPMPNLMYRYVGIFDLPILFGLLMIVVTLIHQEYGLENEQQPQEGQI